MNTKLLLGLAVGGAALWYFSREKEKQEELADQASGAADQVTLTFQETAEQVQEDLPAIEEQVLRALEGIEEAINLQLVDEPLGAFWNPAPWVTGMPQRQTVIEELQSGQSTMVTQRIPGRKRLYEITITRPGGEVLTVRAKVTWTVEGPKVVLFKPGKGFKAIVKTKRDARRRHPMRGRHPVRRVRRAKRVGDVEAVPVNSMSIPNFGYFG